MAAAPPYNAEAEQACLGSCLIDSDAIDLVGEIVSGPQDFYKIANQELYAAILHLLGDNRNIDIITVAEYLRQQGKLEAVGGAAYLDQLMASVASSAHVSEYAHIVADKATERRLIKAGNAIVQLGFEGGTEATEKVDQAEELLYAVSDGRVQNSLLPLEYTLADTFTQLYDSYRNGSPSAGLPTGWQELDSLIGGMQPGNLIVVGARPSMGKTAFALDLARHVAFGSKAAVAIFSLEMSRDEIQQRLLCSTARINNMDLRGGHLRDQDWQRIGSAVNRLSSTPIYIDDQPGQSVLEVKSKLRRLGKREHLALVVIDYLQLMRGSAQFSYGPVNRVQEISEITRQLKGMAKELQVPVVALSQLSRNLENRQDKRPIMADLRESGSIEQDADLIAFLYRDKYYNPGTLEGDTVEVIVAKQRNGPVGTVVLDFTRRYGCFESLADIADGQIMMT